MVLFCCSDKMKVVGRDVQPNLYDNVPFHSQMFGGESFEGHVSKVSAASKVEAQFIIQPQFKSLFPNYGL